MADFAPLPGYPQHPVDLDDYHQMLMSERDLPPFTRTNALQDLINQIQSGAWSKGRTAAHRPGWFRKSTPITGYGDLQDEMKMKHLLPRGAIPSRHGTTVGDFVDKEMETANDLTGQRDAIMQLLEQAGIPPDEIMKIVAGLSADGASIPQLNKQGSAEGFPYYLGCQLGKLLV